MRFGLRFNGGSMYFFQLWGLWGGTFRNKRTGREGEIKVKKEGQSQGRPEE